MYKVATWAEVFQKAKRLKDSGQVIVQRNGYDNVVAMVRGDYGVYEVEFTRQDPNSRAISMWHCTCPWAQFVWFRTGPWRKYEGRVCSHCLAAYWAAKGTPLDDDALEQYQQQEELGQKPPTPLDDILPEDAQEPLSEDETEEMWPGPEGEIPSENADIMPSELPIEPDLTQGPLPKMPELPFKPQGEAEQPSSTKGQIPEMNPIQQGMMELQNRLSPQELDFFKTKYPQFFNIPGTLSHVTGAGGDDFEVFYALLYPGPGKNAQTPTGQMLAEEKGELRGGVNPHPDAVPERYRDDGTPIYGLDDMGYHPDEGIMYTRDRAHQTPERRGDYSTIPVGAVVSILDANPTTKWLKVRWPLKDTAYCQARSVDAWVASKDVKLVGSERLRPDINRRGPKPVSEEPTWETGNASDDWA